MTDRKHDPVDNALKEEQQEGALKRFLSIWREPEEQQECRGKNQIVQQYADSSRELVTFTNEFCSGQGEGEGEEQQNVWNAQHRSCNLSVDDDVDEQK